jgi:hypothetical protein
MLIQDLNNLLLLFLLLGFTPNQRSIPSGYLLQLPVQGSSGYSSEFSGDFTAQEFDGVGRGQEIPQQLMY